MPRGIKNNTSALAVVKPIKRKYTKANKAKSIEVRETKPEINQIADAVGKILAKYGNKYGISIEGSRMAQARVHVTDRVTSEAYINFYQVDVPNEQAKPC